MEARLISAALLVACFMSLGANHRTRNFLITAPDQEFAVRTGELAEQYRRELAIEWLGHELPPWPQPCPIRVKVGNMGAGGFTKFDFYGTTPRNWTMEIFGPADRVLDAVLPHEVTHTIFATHFGRPLPRWADEGACTTVEHPSERLKQERWLITFLTTNRGIPFNKMFAMTEYPKDVMPLYSQAYSLSRFLIAQGGRQKYVKYVGDGMEWNNWTAATREHYGFASLSELQTTWLEWVRQGSPDSIAPRQELAGPATPARPSNLASQNASQNAIQNDARVRQINAVAPINDFAGDSKADDTNSGGGWYQKRRDATYERNGVSPTVATRPQPLGSRMGGITYGIRPVAPAVPVPPQAITNPRTASGGPTYYDPSAVRRY